MILVVPAIDILNGKCVRLEKGDFSKAEMVAEDPVEQVKIFQQMGFEMVHVVDLDAVKQARLVNYEIAKMMKQSTRLKIQFGGGVRNEEAVKQLIEAQIDYIILGSALFTSQKLVEQIIEKYGQDRFVASIDFLNDHVRLFGWEQESKIDVASGVNLVKKLGLKRLIYTDISADGTLVGHNIKLARKMRELFDGFLICSGGINSDRNIEELEKIGIDGVIVGKAIYFSKIDPKRWVKR